MKKFSKWILLILIGVLIALFFTFDLKQYFTLEYIKSQQVLFTDYYAKNPILTIGIYMLVYISSTALSLPGAALLTLLGGAMFGLLSGTIIVSFASSIGATLAFLTARFLLRDWVQNRFSDSIKTINQGVEEEGAFYLFSLRLIPAVPFFIINLVMGLTTMKAHTFFFVSQIGMLAGTIVFVNAGTQLSKINSLSGIASPSIIGSFIILGLFPIVTKKLMQKITKKKGNTSNV